jgi:hypothetical protein
MFRSWRIAYVGKAYYYRQPRLMKISMHVNVAGAKNHSSVKLYDNSLKFQPPTPTTPIFPRSTQPSLKSRQ